MPKTAKLLAIELNVILDAVYSDRPEKRYPVDVSGLAKEISKQRFPDDAITAVKGGHLPGFEGGLFRAPKGKRGWGIIYNNSIQPESRVRFTIAHELGHYLLHRKRYPDGIHCERINEPWALEEYRSVEREANQFAAYLLIPANDLCRQIPPFEKPTFDQLIACADRYHVSLTSAVLQWVDNTRLRAVAVFSRDGSILWTNLSRSAKTTSAFYGSKGMPLPHESPAMRRHFLPADESRTVEHGDTVWFGESCTETALTTGQHGLAISLLVFEPKEVYYGGNEPSENALDRSFLG